MKSIATALMFVVAAWSTGPVCSLSFRANDYIDDYTIITTEYMNKGICNSTFVPYFVDFNYENTPYLLWVHDSSLSYFPNTSRDGNANSFMNSTYIFIYCDTRSADFTVNFKASLGTVNDNTYNATDCLITASNTESFWTSGKVMVRNYTGSNYIYIYPARNWTIIGLSLDIKALGIWSITASCPGANDNLVSKMTNVFQETILTRLQDIIHSSLASCFTEVLSLIEAADYITD